jgi:hypothetical protein
MKVCGGVDVWLHAFLTSTLDGAKLFPILIGWGEKGCSGTTGTTGTTLRRN